MHGSGDMNLACAAKYWKTPHGFQNTDASGKTAGGGGEFAKQVMQWRTPDSPGAGGPRNRKKSIGHGHQTTIAEQAEQWPTPVVGDHRSGITGKVAKKNARPLCEAVSAFSLPDRRTSKHGPKFSKATPNSLRQLNPLFVEWLMGVPLGWTSPAAGGSADFARWAMVSSLSARRMRTSASKLLCKTADLSA